VSESLLKFPSTPHLAVLGGQQVRGDKVMDEPERSEFLRHELVVEEKVDGANLGISFGNAGNVRLQNRGTYLHPPNAGQWKHLDAWLQPKLDALFDALMDRYILFGEWCYAQHSVAYTRLPDWFLVFDVLDRRDGRFLSSCRRDELIRGASLCSVPEVARGRFTLDALRGLLATSKVGDGPAEGLYLRCDAGDWLGARAKLVRPEFIQTIDEHWARKPLVPNQLRAAVEV